MVLETSQILIASNEIKNKIVNNITEEIKIIICKIDYGLMPTPIDL